jgi:CubicO group peptidase (beta-lactamase class C family)
MKSKKFGNIIFLAFVLIGCTKDDSVNEPFTDSTPLEINDGLNLSNPVVENMDEQELQQIYQDIYNDENLWSMRSFLVFRNNKLVAESYMQGDKYRTEPQLIWSCTKQVLGILVGIAIDEGHISSLDDPISNYFDTELSGHEDKSDITVRNLITMQSGIDYDNDGVGGETDKLLREIPDDMVEFILSRPIYFDQGTDFHYNDGDPHLVSAIIQKQVGQPTDEWADASFFSKIEMTNYNWVRYKDGSTYGGYGLETTPREMGKMGLCILDSGKWNGQQVVPANWNQEMTTPFIQETDIDYSFGYYWWIDEQRDIQFMWGHGGQFVFVIPDKDLVVVTTAIPNTQGKYQILADEVLPYVDRIIEACD